MELKRPGVGLADLDLEVRTEGHTLRPQQRVAVGECHPVLVLAEPEQDGIVDDPPALVAQHHVLALPDRARVEVPRREHVRERVGVGAGDFQTSFDRDVPHRYVVDQVPVLIEGIGVPTRDVHVVVDVVGDAPGALRRFPVGGLANPGAVDEEQGYVRRPARGVHRIDLLRSGSCGQAIVSRNGGRAQLRSGARVRSLTRGAMSWRSRSMTERSITARAAVISS